MVVKGYYVWVRHEGKFETIFLPTADIESVNKYLYEHTEFEYLGHTKEEKTFTEHEKTSLFELMLEINNL